MSEYDCQSVLIAFRDVLVQVEQFGRTQAENTGGTKVDMSKTKMVTLYLFIFLFLILHQSCR